MAGAPIGNQNAVGHGAPQGNENAKRGKMFKESLRRALAKASDDGSSIGGLDKVASTLVRSALAGEQWAVQDVSIEKAMATQRRYLKIGDSNIPMSTGLLNGDGYQASHFLNGGITGQAFGIMDPTLALGETLSISDYDLLVFDAIGWDIVAVPEPTTGTTALAGLACGGLWMWQRRNRLPQFSKAA